MDLLMLFIVLTILFFILSIYLMETNPKISIPFIMVGMIFTILVTYGLWNVEVLYVGYNATSGFTTTDVYATSSYGDPYSYIFMLLFFVFLVLFFRAGFNMWQEARATQPGMDYRARDRRWR